MWYSTEEESHWDPLELFSEAAHTSVAVDSPAVICEKIWKPEAHQAHAVRRKNGDSCHGCERTLFDKCCRSTYYPDAFGSFVSLHTSPRQFGLCHVWFSLP